MKSPAVNKRSFPKFDRRSPRVLFASVAVAVVVLCATLFPFASASCRTTTQDAPATALEQLRRLAHLAPPVGGDALTRFERDAQQIETANRGTSAAALARTLRARTRAERAGYYAGAARLLDDATLLSQTAIGDYVLSLRASYLEKLNRKQEARAVYEQLARDYPTSLRRSHAATRAAELVIEETPDKQAGARAALLTLRGSIEQDDAGALLLAAAAETSGDAGTSVRHLRRIIFYRPAAPEAVAARSALARLNASIDPATIDEARTRAERLYDARRFADAADAYGELARRFPAAVNPQTNLRRGIALANVRRLPEAAAALRSIPLSAGETHAEALAALAIAQARAKAFTDAQTTLDELRRQHPRSTHTRDALVRAGEAARDAKNSFHSQNFFRAAVASFPGSPEVAGAQFEIAWAAHEAGRFDESARLLVEHIASYADRNTDNRGRAGYWAARDSERANRLGDAAALYEAMLARYDANWYGYLAKQQLERLRPRIGSEVLTSSNIDRAVANLKTITVGSSTLTADDEPAFARAEQLGAIGLDDFAFAEFDLLAAKHPTDPRANLARAQLHRARTATIANERVPALNALRRSYPDYSQMKPEELSRAEWEIFYPLTHWDVIRREAEAKRLDPYIVAGLIRQETIFDPRAASHANAYGLMQLLVPTAQTVARRYGVGRAVSRAALFDPELNITLGTGYMRDQFDEFGKLEYVAAAYNAGPGRPRRWRNELPAAIDEWTEAIPFRETRGYVQGVVRNMLQYRRLYDEQGRFRTEVGTRPARSQTVVAPRQPTGSNDDTRPRRVAPTSNEDDR